MKPRSLVPCSRLTLGDQIIDGLFGGGIPCGSITEITGEAGASKTQLCLQLLLTAQLSSQYGGLDASSIYIYTEGDPPLPRLRQLSGLIKQRYPPQAFSHNNQTTTTAASTIDLMDGIYIERITTKIDLLQRLHRIEPLLQHGQGKRRVKLLIIDSVASIYRDLQDGGMGAATGGQGGAGELTERSEALFKLSGILRKYADEYQIAVVVINQAVDCIATNNIARTRSSAQQQHQHVTAGLQLHSKGRQVAPALGLAWANCVNTRVFLSRESESNYVVEGCQPVRRRMIIVFSPYLPQWECAYVVEHGGVRGVAGGG